jgi:hypothetical protein
VGGAVQARIVHKHAIALGVDDSEIASARLIPQDVVINPETPYIQLHVRERFYRGWRMIVNQHELKRALQLLIQVVVA